LIPVPKYNWKSVKAGGSKELTSTLPEAHGLFLHCNTYMSAAHLRAGPGIGQGPAEGM
jgi:hypothetical protein